MWQWQVLLEVIACPSATVHIAIIRCGNLQASIDMSWAQSWRSGLQHAWQSQHSTMRSDESGLVPPNLESTSLKLYISPSKRMWPTLCW